MVSALNTEATDSPLEKSDHGCNKRRTEKTPVPVTLRKQSDTCLGCGAFLDLPSLILEVCCIRFFSPNENFSFK